MADIPSDLPPFPPDPSAPPAPITEPGVPPILLLWQSLRREGEKHWFYYLCHVGVLCAFIYWLPYSRLPWPGVAVAIIAVLAALMSVHGDIHPRHKFIYFALMAALLVTEFRAMRKDREVNEAVQKEWNRQEDDRLVDLLAGERANTKALLDQENQSFEGVLTQSQTDFNTTMRKFSDNQNVTMREFAKNESANQVRFNKIIEHEEEVTESERGILAPSNLPTPPTNCRFATPDAITVVLDQQGRHFYSTFTKFPHTIMASKSHGPILTVDRIPNGNITVNFDIRSSDGKIIARMGQDGYVINRNNTLEIKKTAHSIDVVDLYGQNVMSLEYLNKQAILIRGNIFGFPPLMSEICSSNSTVDYEFP
jgi:hypothetical protein